MRLARALARQARSGGPVTTVLIVLVVATLSSSLVGGRVFGSADNLLSWLPYSVARPALWTRPANPLLTDPVVGFVPDLLQTRADLFAGSLPLWSPYAGAGHPLLATQVHAPLFPLTWLAFLLPFWSSLAWIAAARLLLAAGGTYLLCRALDLRRGPALLGATAFAFGSYFFVWLEHPQTNVWLILPWALLAAHRLCARGSLTATSGLGAAAGLAWLGGHPESAAFVSATAAAYAGFELLVAPRRGASSRRRRGGLVLVALILGAAVGAIVNVPLFELLREAGPTGRGGPGAPLAAAWSSFFPELWGSPAKVFYAGGPLNFNERTAYIGVLPLLLALGGLARRPRREQAFFLIVAVVLLATVFDTPLWADLVRSLPGGKLTALTRLLVVVSLAGAVLAAYGLQRWLDGGAPERRRMLVVMGLAAVLPPLAWVVLHTGDLSSGREALGQLPTVHEHEASRAVVALGAVWRWVVFAGAGLGALVLARRTRRPGIVAVGLAVAITGADLVTLDRGYHGAVPLAQADPPVPATIRYLVRHQGDARVVGAGYAMPANTGSRYGVRDARIAIDVPYPLRYASLWTGLGGVGGDQERFEFQAPGAHRLADVFAVRYVVLSPDQPAPRWLQPVRRTTAATITRNPTALPRAWVAYGWRTASGQRQALAATLASSSASLRERPVIEGASAPPPRAPGAGTPARLVSDGPDSVTVVATARRPGQLILDDSAYPGWRASLDGRPVAWRPANLAFRAVALPRGRHVVTFRYRPASVALGAAVSALSVLALAILALAGAVRSRRRRPPATS